ncbi:MAG: enoyl-CoA hydratase-related protein [Paracoccaceae bacterium]|nr:enoyl-CoA hydratase-related protein [Paracoccaceae bacterium]
MVEERSQGRIARLELSNPKKLNALSPSLIVALHAHATALTGDPDLRAVVLTGAGTRAFAAGADIGTLAKLDEATARGFITSLHQAIDAVRRIPVPVIAAMRGYCFGGAMELAAACDIRIADTRFTTGMPEVRLGIPSVIEACLLPRLVGWGKASELVLTGESIDADEAHRIGFLQRLCAPEALEAETERMLAAILASGPQAVRAQKRIMRGWEGLPEADAIAASILEFSAIHATSEPADMIAPVLARRRRK